jgi:hypothetical protein
MNFATELITSEHFQNFIDYLEDIRYRNLCSLKDLEQERKIVSQLLSADIGMNYNKIERIMTAFTMALIDGQEINITS